MRRRELEKVAIDKGPPSSATRGTRLVGVYPSRSAKTGTGKSSPQQRSSLISNPRDSP
ncbi:hypothetical protein SK128_026088, partial [Halocaridina rubra]